MAGKVPLVYISGISKEKRRGGTVVMGGNITANDPITNAPLGIIMGFHAGASFGGFPKLVSDNDVGTTKAQSGGTFASFVARKFIIVRVTTSLAGVSNNALLYGSNDGKHFSILFNENSETTRVRTAGWNWATGKQLTTPTQHKDVYVSIDGSSGDVAARPSRAVPGKIVFMFGAKDASTVNYKAKTE